MNSITKNAQECLGRRCIAFAAKLELQERNAPHHDVLLWREGGLLEDIEEIDSKVYAGLPRPGTDDDLRELVQRLNVYTHSPYRKRKGKCRFGYD